MVEGAGLELSKVKETLEAKLAQKEQETARLSQVQTLPPNNAKIEAQLNKLSHDVQGLFQRLNPLCQGNHISHFLLHPKLVDNNNAASSSSNDQCPVCYKVFDRWSGYYMLPCRHYYHFICLVHQMQNASTCLICSMPINLGLYTMFGMSSDYKALGQQDQTPSAIQNLFTGEN